MKYEKQKEHLIKFGSTDNYLLWKVNHPFRHFKTIKILLNNIITSEVCKQGANPNKRMRTEMRESVVFKKSLCININYNKEWKKQLYNNNFPYVYTFKTTYFHFDYF